MGSVVSFNRKKPAVYIIEINELEEVQRVSVVDHESFRHIFIKAETLEEAQKLKDQADRQISSKSFSELTEIL